jgi:hypothetical protein
MANTHFQTKNPKLGKFLQQSHLVNFTTFGVFCGHLVYLFPILVHCTGKNLATLYIWDKERENRFFSISVGSVEIEAATRFRGKECETKKWTRS